MTETTQAQRLSDANYPDVAIHTSAKVERWLGGTWHYRVTLRFVDAVYEEISCSYESKQLATEAMMLEHQAVILKLVQRFSKS